MIEADPFVVKAAGVTHYRSAGQREAIRAVLATPPTTTVIGNLPTGTGKSLVAYMPALMASRPGTTVVVVPTTSLALDQERAFLERIDSRADRARFPSELAYHGELSEGTRARDQGTDRVRLAKESSSRRPKALLNRSRPRSTQRLSVAS